MKHYSQDKQIDDWVGAQLRQGCAYRRGRKHGQLLLPNGYHLVIPGTPGDRRAMLNLKTIFRRLSSRDKRLGAPAP